jgi:hypothetical protein
MTAFSGLKQPFKHSLSELYERTTRNWGRAMFLLKKNVNLSCFLFVLAIYLTGQCLIGTALPNSAIWTTPGPIDNDILYYAAQANQIGIQFPPQEPAYAGVRLFRSWLTLIPVTMLTPMTGPYVAMRFLNLVAVLLMAYLSYRYLPGRWGVFLLLLLTTFSPKIKVHSFGINMIFKSFYHLPFYIAFLVIFFEKRHRWLRYFCLLCLPWLHAFSTIAATAFFFAKLLVYRNMQSLLDLLIAGGGIAIYAFLFSPSDAVPFYELLLQGFYLDPLEPLLHVLIWVPFIYYCQNKDLLILFGTAFVLTSLSHWYPFYFIYFLEFATALIVTETLGLVSAPIRRAFIPAVSVMVVLFVAYASLIKFSLDVPVDVKAFKSVLQWASSNTPATSVFLIAPPTEENQEKELPLIQEIRALYYGIPYQVQTIGLDRTGERYHAALQTYTHRIVPPGVDFVFYGPFERQRFPHFSGVGVEVYRDSYVSVFDVRVGSGR